MFIHLDVFFLFISQIEADISKRYKNRPVNLMGGINVF